MKKYIQIIVRTSCDDQFIRRVAHEDPFEYFNRILHDAIGYEDGLLKTRPEGVRVTVTENKLRDTMPFTHTIQYDIDNDKIFDSSTIDKYCTAIITYFQPTNVISFQQIKIKQ